MARFYGSIQGARGVETRVGTPQSGMSAHIRGWNTGVNIVLAVDARTGKDQITLYRTGGSNTSALQLLAQWTEGEEAEHFFNPLPEIVRKTKEASNGKL